MLSNVIFFIFHCISLRSAHAQTTILESHTAKILFEKNMTFDILLTRIFLRILGFGYP